MILEIFSSGPFDTNTYIVGCSATKQAVIIDVPFESARWLVSRVQKLSLVPTHILLTHSHWDHIADVSELKNSLNLPVYVHEKDAANLIHLGADGLPIFMEMKGVMPDGYLLEGAKISVGEHELIVLHTPGHTPGSVCFYGEKDKILFSGDTLFQGSMGRVDFPTSSPSDMWESLKKLSLLASDTRVYPGHGDSTTIGAEKWMAHAEKKFG